MNNIALAFSGGGLRAAGFALGTLSYLNQVDFNDGTLLSKVSFIRSTSGGSITNLAYSLSLASNQSFAGTYQSLLHVMDGELLIQKAFGILRNDKAWAKRPHKTRNLINAFSIAYDELIFDHAKLECLSDGLVNTHLREVCVNATGFANGIGFRFQSQHALNNGLGKGRIGNGYIHFQDQDEENVGNQLRLADILACSSCFPGGFEPFMFPDDFSSDTLPPAKLKEHLIFKDNPFTREKKLTDDNESCNNDKCFGLMDVCLAGYACY